MDQVIHHMPTLSEAKNAVEIVVHVSDCCCRRKTAVICRCHEVAERDGGLLA
jgi:hypothetical protein